MPPPPSEIPIGLPVDVLILWKEPNLVREGRAIVMEGTRNIVFFQWVRAKEPAVRSREDPQCKKFVFAFPDCSTA